MDPYVAKGAEDIGRVAGLKAYADEVEGFKRTEKAAQASKLNLSARLSHEGTDGEGRTGGSWREVARLLKIARPELRPLSLAFVFLLISSGVTMSIPFSIGKLMDAATQLGAHGSALARSTLSDVYGVVGGGMQTLVLAPRR